jgi:transcriptional regulator with XRE-family HTH domain
MFHTLGERITYCRNLLNLSRNNLVENLKGEISLPTLARWELNTVIPSKKKIEMLKSYFEKNGIQINPEWLKNGVGYPPVSLELKKFDCFQFDEVAYTSLVAIRNQIKDFYFSQVNSNYFQPVVSFGDYVGGILEPNKKLLNNKLCFLFTENIATVGIYLHDKNILSNREGDIYEIRDSQDIKIGEAQWIIRRP